LARFTIRANSGSARLPEFFCRYRVNKLQEKTGTQSFESHAALRRSARDSRSLYPCEGYVNRPAMLEREPEWTSFLALLIGLSAL